MTRLQRFAFVAVVAFVLCAFALKKDVIVFVKARNTKLLQKADGASRVITTLRPGDPVYWQEGPENREFHKVKLDGGPEGYVYFAALSVKPPEPEYEADAGQAVTVSPKAFASSGAATKALSEGAIVYGEEKLDAGEATREIATLEQISDAVTFDVIGKHVQPLGLPMAMSSKEASR